MFVKFLTLLHCVGFLESHLFNSSNGEAAVEVEKEVVSMASEMPDFVSSEPMPNRSKEITLIYTLRFYGFFPIGSPATETVRIALKRLSSMPNWLPGYNLRFEMIENFNSDEIAIPALLTKIRNFPNQSLFPITLLTESSSNAQLISATILKEFNFTSLTIYQNTMELANRR